MEDILSIYERPYDPEHPVICMDEASRQLLEHSRTPIIGSDGVTRIDSEYIRNGEQKIFLATEPLTGWRMTWVNETRTKADWAQFMDMVIAQYPTAKQLTLVCDNLNTHNGSSFYEVYTPEKAKELCDKLDIHYTPKHGSWLDIAEIELSALQKQCLQERRYATKRALTAAVNAWEQRRNQQAKPINWQFTTKDARVKLRKLYPNV